MEPNSVALLVYGDISSARDALTEEKYKDLANAFVAEGFKVMSVLYNDQRSNEVYKTLLDVDAVLVWVNPIEQGNNRNQLDAMLAQLSYAGRFVSAHPEIILKIGTKDVLYKTKDIGWVGTTDLYSDHDDFVNRFRSSLNKSGSKVLKQYRGNGGNGVFKIVRSADEEVTIIHARNGNEVQILNWTDFLDEFRSYFVQGGLLIEQEWNENLANGMVRCYLCGNKVAGFGYQEINALYELDSEGSKSYSPPSKRYYFTENCGLFSDLKTIMENAWVPQLQKGQSISDEMMPVIWDADFFINDINSTRQASKYSLCEINVSSVSPFPPSAVKFIVKETVQRIKTKSTETRFVG